MDVLRRTEEVQKELEAIGASSGGGEGEGPVNWRVMEVQGSSFDFTPSAGGLVCEVDRSDLERFDVR